MIYDVPCCWKPTISDLLKSQWCSTMCELNHCVKSPGLTNMSQCISHGFGNKHPLEVNLLVLDRFQSLENVLLFSPKTKYSFMQVFVKKLYSSPSSSIVWSIGDLGKKVRSNKMKAGDII